MVVVAICHQVFIIVGFFFIFFLLFLESEYPILFFLIVWALFIYFLFVNVLLG